MIFSNTQIIHNPRDIGKGLLRSLTLKDAVGIGLGALIQEGIFLATGVAAGISSPAFIIGLLIGGIIATFNALSSSQLTPVYPQFGGTYEYGHILIKFCFWIFSCKQGRHYCVNPIIGLEWHLVFFVFRLTTFFEYF